MIYRTENLLPLVITFHHVSVSGIGLTLTVFTSAASISTVTGLAAHSTRGSLEDSLTFGYLGCCPLWRPFG